MSPETAAGHRPPSHRRRVPLLRVAAVVVLGGVVVAGVTVGVLALLSGGPSEPRESMVADVGGPSGTVESSAGPPAEGAGGGADRPVVPSGDGSVLAPEEDDPSVDSSFRVTEVTPPDGSTTGGEAVVITGTGFREGVGVRFAGREAPLVEVLNDRKLRVILPPGLPGEATVEVGSAIDVPYRAEGLFAYVDRPPRVVMAVRPTVGSLSGGTAITIVGTGFEPGARVVIGGERAFDVEVLDSTRITAMTPAHEEGLVDVIVRNPGMPTAVLPGAFEFVPGPTLTGMDPVEITELGGIRVTVWGTGFAPGVEVTLNGLPAYDVQVLDETMLTATAPPGVPGPATLVVRNPGQPPATLLDAAFYVVPPPVEEALPSEAPAPTGEVPAGDPAAPTEPVPPPAPAPPEADEPVPPAADSPVPPAAGGADPAAG